jgi:hypothetical protein
MDKIINVQELISLSKTDDKDKGIPICCVGEMRPVYSQNACGQQISCAMSSVNREQGYINGIPYCSVSYNNVMNPEIIRGCCAIFAQPVDPNMVIHINPDIQKG